MSTLTLYGSSVADATLTNACDMANTTGGVETSKTTTVTGANNFAEVLSQGGTAASVTSIPTTPTGHGWVSQPGAGTFAIGNWSASETSAITGFTASNSKYTIRFFRYSSGVYTLIGTIDSGFIASTSKTTYTFAATSMSAITFGASDLLYVDLWYTDTTGTGTENTTIYVSTSSSSGVANDLQVTTSNFTATGSVGSNTRYDLSVYKEQQVLVYDQSGNFIDCVRDVPLLSGFREVINGVTSPLKIQLPRKFEQLDLLGNAGAHGTMNQGYIWKYYLFGPGLPSGGQLRFSGQVDAYEPQIADSGEETIPITITPQGSALADAGIGGTVAFGTVGSAGTYVDPITQFNYFFNNNDPITGNSYCDPLTLDGSNPASSGVTTQFTYANQTIQSIFDNIILMLPANYFYRTNPDLSVTLNQTPLTAQHTLQVGVHLSNPQYSQSWIQTKTAVYFVGGVDPTTISPANPNGSPIVSIQRGVDMETIGERIYFHNESRVTDQVTANALAQGDLNYYDQPLLITKIRVPDYRGPNPGVGYDIESMQVGESIQIQDNTFNGTSTLWDGSNWNTGIWDQSPGPAFNVVGVISALTYGFFYVDIEIGLPQPSLSRAVYAIQKRLQDFTVL